MPRPEPRFLSGGLLSTLVIFLLFAATLGAQQLDFIDRNRPILDAHNCYPYKGE